MAVSLYHICVCVWKGGGEGVRFVCVSASNAIRAFKNCQLKFFDENCKINTQRPSKIQILWDNKIGIYHVQVRLTLSVCVCVCVCACLCENDSAVWIHPD